MSTVPKLLAQPGRIGSMELKNRLVMPAMCTNYTFQGHFTDQAVHYYGLRARGGVALIIIEASAIEYPVGRSILNNAVSDDRYIPTLRKLTDEVHRYGTKIALQIMHSGRQTSIAVCGSQPVSCSATASTQILYDLPRELTLYECKKIIEGFGEGALRAKKAGFDAVEVHCAHGYLLHEFLSPLSNRRTDDYGGSFENRARFPLEVVGAVRKVWAENLPLFVRISATDWVEGGWDLAQSVKFAGALKKIGVDLIDCSSGGAVPGAKIPVEPGYQVPFAEKIRKECGIMTGAVGLITEPEQAEEIIAGGKADAVFLARAFLRDPYWAVHAAKALGVSLAPVNQYARA